MSGDRSLSADAAARTWIKGRLRRARAVHHDASRVGNSYLDCLLDPGVLTAHLKSLTEIDIR